MPKPNDVTAVLRALAMGAVLTALVFVPQWRYEFSWSDEGLLWYLSKRVAVGELPIRDFYGYDPGRYFWSAAWFKLLGRDGLLEQRIANAAFGCMALSAAWLGMEDARVPLARRAATALLLAMALGYPRHKTYEQALALFATLAVYVVLTRRDSARAWGAFGLATGFAAVIGRNSGVYFVVAGLLAVLVLGRAQRHWISARCAASWSAGVVLGYLPVLLLVSFAPGFADAMLVSIKSVAEFRPPLPVPFPWRLDLRHVHGFARLQPLAVSMLCVAVVLVYASTLVRTLLPRAPAEHDTRNAWLGVAAAVSGVPYLHQAFDRADFGHIAQGIVPLFLLIASEGPRWARSTRLELTRYVVIAACALLAWLPYQPRIHTWLGARIDPQAALPFDLDGRSYVIKREQSAVLAALQRAARSCGLYPGAVLAAPHYPGVYAVLGVRAPFWELYYLYPRTLEFQREHIAALRRQHTQLALLNFSASVDERADLRLPETYPELVAFVQKNYVLLDTRDSLPSDFRLYASPSCAARLGAAERVDPGMITQHE